MIKRGYGSATTIRRSIADAWAAAAYTAKNLDWLEAETRAFVDAVCESDLPAVVKESALFNLSTLRSQTVFRTRDGFMFGWEGCDDTAGCCFGSCTHVWNYEQATAHLFGGLALGMREVEFNYATRKDGGMSFRVELPLEHAKAWSLAAADGQMGCIMKLYRDWQLSGDDDRLRSMWENARRALEFCWQRGGWDADKDGIMEGCQHNTMDVEYYGPNPQMGIWYLGALRAMEEMARHLGESNFADDCRRLYENGSGWIDANLFNGDYYEHEIRPASGVDAVLGMLMSDMGAPTRASPFCSLAKAASSINWWVSSSLMSPAWATSWLKITSSKRWAASCVTTSKRICTVTSTICALMCSTMSRRC